MGRAFLFMLISKYSRNLQFLNNLQPTVVFASYWGSLPSVTPSTFDD
jgi:hypothetical protein